MLCSYFNRAYAYEALVLSFTPWTPLCRILRYSLPPSLPPFLPSLLHVIFILLPFLFATSSSSLSFLHPHHSSYLLSYLPSLFLSSLLIYTLSYFSPLLSCLHSLSLSCLHSLFSQSSLTPDRLLLFLHIYIFLSIHLFLSHPSGHTSSASSPFQKQPSDYLHYNKSSTSALPSTSTPAYTPAYTPVYASSSVYGGR
jgi:hypothetical protein